MANLRLGRVNLRPVMAGLRRGRVDFRSERANFMPEKVFLGLWGDGKWRDRKNFPVWNHRSLVAAKK